MPVTQTKNFAFLEDLATIPDPRVPGMVLYPLQEILFVLVVGVLCGCEDWEDIRMVTDANISWFRRYLPFKHGIASAHTLHHVCNRLSTEAFGDLLLQSLSGLSHALQEEGYRTIALDGKALRGSKLAASGEGALHMLSAYGHKNRLVLGQQILPGKGHEVTAIPEVIEALSPEAGTVFTIDAAGAQKKIVAQILAKDCDYVIGLKANQRGLYEDIALFFKEAHSTGKWQQAETTCTGHGRVETRFCLATQEVDWLHERHPEWSSIRTIVRVRATRYEKKYKKETTEDRFYISSLEVGAGQLLEHIRGHWGIENGLHWVLDVAFREDACRVRKGNAAANLAIIRRLAYNLLRADPTKRSIKKKQRKALLSATYRETLMRLSEN